MTTKAGVTRAHMREVVVLNCLLSFRFDADARGAFAGPSGSTLFELG